MINYSCLHTDHAWAYECIEVYRQEVGKGARDATEKSVDDNLAATLIRLLLDWYGYRVGRVDRNQMVNTLRDTELLLLGMVCVTLAAADNITTPPPDNDDGVVK